MSSSSSFLRGEFFTTPETERRPDGLCATKLRQDYTAADVPEKSVRSLSKEDYIRKCQQTSSKFLNPTIRKRFDPLAEIEFISSSISTSLNEIVGEGEDFPLKDYKFEPKGCIWTLNLNISPDYQIVSICSAEEQEQISTTYVVETYLLEKRTGKGAVASMDNQSMQSEFDVISTVVGKALIKCEFPNFPEGCQGRKFKEVYKLNAKLKAGLHSTICRGTHRETQTVVCVKCVRRSADLPLLTDAAIYDEVALLSSVSHPHVVPLIDFFEEADCYYLVKELQTGGEILQRVGQLGNNYGEGDAREILKNLLGALSACHSNQITHRDINPKNVLLMKEESNTHVKFTGFGFAARCHEPKSLNRILGTPVFVAPEVLRKQPYDMQSDMWSVGVLAYILLSGRLPFVGLNQRELFRNIVMGKYEFDDDHWEDVSTDAKAFVSRLLVVDPSKRMTAESASKHLWMQLKYVFLQKRNLENASERIKVFYEKQQIHKQESHRNLMAGK